MTLIMLNEDILKQMKADLSPIQTGTVLTRDLVI